MRASTAVSGTWYLSRVSHRLEEVLRLPGTLISPTPIAREPTADEGAEYEHRGRLIETPVYPDRHPGLTGQGDQSSEATASTLAQSNCEP